MAACYPTASARATVMYWSFAVSAAATLLLSLPPTNYVMRGIKGEIAFHFEIGLVAFIVVAFVLGFFMSLGKAAVFKHIATYYPENVGAVGGLVGMIGGLGGFFLPYRLRGAQRAHRPVVELLHAAVCPSSSGCSFGWTSRSVAWSDADRAPSAAAPGEALYAAE